MVRTIPLVLFLAACSGDGRAPPPSAPPPPGPALALRYPPAGSAVESATLVVRGTTDPDGHEPVVAVTVGGVAATSGDDFATWTAEVALEPGRQQLVVSARNEAGGVTTAPLDIERTGTLLSRPIGICCEGDRAWVMDRNERVVEVDLSSGARRRVDLSGTSFERFGPYDVPLGPPMDIVVDAAAGFAWLTHFNAVYRVDLATGVRSIFVAGNIAYMGAPQFGLQNGGAITLDRARGRLLVCDRQRRGLIAYDLETRLYTVVAQGEQKTGLRRGMAFDPGSGTIYSVHDSIRAIDADSGETRVVSEPGNGPDISSNAFGAAVGPGGRLLYVADPEQRAILEIDLQSGARRILPGSGVPLVAPRDLALDAPRDRLLLADDGLDALVAIALATGERSLVSSFSLGSGPAPATIVALARDATGRLLALRTDGDLVFADGGARETLVAFAADGTPQVFAADPEGGGFFVGTSEPDALWAIDRATGAARLVADLPAPPRGVVAWGGSLLVIDAALSLWRVDPASGAREIVSDRTHGSGPYFYGYVRMALDDVSGRLVVVNGGNVAYRGSGQLFFVDPANGDREKIVSYSTGGAGSAVLALDVESRRVFIPSSKRLVTISLDDGSREVLELEGLAPDQPLAAHYDTERGWLVVADGDRGALLALDPETGQSAVLAR